MAEKAGSPPKKRQTNWLKIKVNENELVPWTKNQGRDGEAFPTKDAPQFNDTDQKVFIKQLLRVAVSAGKATNEEEYQARYVTSQYRLAKQFVTDTSSAIDNTENKMIVFAKSTDESWLRSVCEWVKNTSFHRRTTMSPDYFKRAVTEFESSVCSPVPIVQNDSFMSAQGTPPQSPVSSSLSSDQPQAPANKIHEHGFLMDGDWANSLSGESVGNSSQRVVELEAQVEEMREDLATLLQCAISFELMNDPVVTPSGQLYERSKIEQWIHSNHSDPSSRKSLRRSQLISVRGLKDIADKYRGRGILECDA